MFEFITNFFRPQVDWPAVSIDDIRKKARILVIDDEEFPYKPLFERDDYDIEKWDDVEKVNRLEEGYYDVILLDIQGVGRQQSADQGLGVLKHIKAENPTQLVIAYSNSDFSLRYQQFFDLADAKIAKSDDYVKFKEAVDRLLQLKYSINFYIDLILKNAEGQLTTNTQVVAKTREALIKRDEKILGQYLASQSSGIDADTAKRLMKIVRFGMQTAYVIAKIKTGALAL